MGGTSPAQFSRRFPLGHADGATRLDAVRMLRRTESPGPWGLFALVPEMVMVIQNQVQLIYDIGVASGKRDRLTRELVLSIALSACGTSAMSVLTMKGGTLLVRRTSLRMFQKLVRAFAGRVTQQMVKSAVAKWLPIVGAAAVAAWTRYTTHEIGRRAKEIFALDIQSVGDEADEGEDAVVATEAPSEDAAIAKLLLLDDLMRCDGEVAAREQELITELVEHSGLGARGRATLVRRLDERSPRTVELESFRADRDEAIGLLMDMAALSKRDGDVRESEREFVLRVATAIGMSESQVVAALG